jgi:hypothetical protein
VLPTKLRKRLDRVHVTLLSSYLGHTEALERARRALDRQDPAILDLLAHALFELAFAHLWAGDPAPSPVGGARAVLGDRRAGRRTVDRMGRTGTKHA